ncbi:MAG TPA: TadE family protein [Candidatus Deferrimicrobiaceae bacterium]|nr:TadE family protein [Candidatus Deferrimicrobiaceae bacterium]
MGESALRTPGRHHAELRRRLRQRGQSLVEFSIVLPVMLAMVGIVIDVSRLYQTWTNLEAATRDAAQYLARSDPDPLAADHTGNGSDADQKALFIVNRATGLTFQRSGTQGVLSDCLTAPRLTTSFSESAALAGGGSTAYPVGTAKVMTCVPFRTLFAYPFLTTDGTWVLRSEREISIIVGR